MAPTAIFCVRRKAEPRNDRVEEQKGQRAISQRTIRPEDDIKTPRPKPDQETIKKVGKRDVRANVPFSLCALVMMVVMVVVMMMPAVMMMVMMMTNLHRDLGQSGSLRPFRFSQPRIVCF